MPNDGTTTRLLLLGSTGSIGTQTLEVVRHLKAMHAEGRYARRFEVVGRAAGRRGELLAEQAEAFGVGRVALCDLEAAYPGDATLLRGEDAAERLVRETDADVVLAAMVGSAGLPATLAAAELGRSIALANKETLVAAGELVCATCARTGARLLPVDSEHAAVWQCLMSVLGPGCSFPEAALSETVSRVVLTASGGPFRGRDPEEVAGATPAQALKHPNWSMGAKVTIDSATLTNKALELIEAHWLFGVGNDRLGAIVHPQSIVHAMVELRDGSLLAQMGLPDMRGPIQLALSSPDAIDGCGPDRLDLAALGKLTFEDADPERYPALELARRVIATGGTAGAIMNAANEAAVGAFLKERVRFGEIVGLTREAMDAIPARPCSTLDEVLDADRAARAHVEQAITALS